jgi:hypothetical protein
MVALYDRVGEGVVCYTGVSMHNNVSSSIYGNPKKANLQLKLPKLE